MILAENRVAQNQRPVAGSQSRQQFMRRARDRAQPRHQHVGVHRWANHNRVNFACFETRFSPAGKPATVKQFKKWGLAPVRLFRILWELDAGTVCDRIRESVCGGFF